MTWLNDALLVVKAMAHGFYVATPYWVLHALVALTIALALWPVFGLNAGLAAGAAFYCGREFTQWESGLPFDWKGLAAPLVACSTVYCLPLFWK